MLSYSQELRENRERHNAPIDPCWNEYLVLKQTKSPYKYDECYDYAAEALPHLIKCYKDWGFDDYELAARNAMFEKFNPNISLHKRAYMYWEDMAWEKFKKNWKPIDNQGLNYMWITINFAPDTPMPVVVVETARIVNLPLFKDTTITYVYEFHTSGCGHPHVHMLIELKRTGTICYATIKEKILQKKSLEKYQFNCKIQQSWAHKHDYRCHNNRAWYQAYVRGHKALEKEDNVEKDRLWRAENNLEELYIKEN